MMNKTHMLVQDNDAHWYVIPIGKVTEFSEWLHKIEDSEEDDTPSWADRVGGAPSLVTFHEEGYTLDGVRVGGPQGNAPLTHVSMLRLQMFFQVEVAQALPHLGSVEIMEAADERMKKLETYLASVKAAGVL